MAQSDLPKFVGALASYLDWPKNLLCEHEDGPGTHGVSENLPTRSFAQRSDRLAAKVFNLHGEGSQKHTTHDVFDKKNLLASLQEPNESSPSVPPVISSPSSLSSQNNPPIAVIFDSAAHPPLTQPASALSTMGSQDLTFLSYNKYQRDPLCRIICVLAPNSRNPLLISPEMFKLLATYHQIMPEISNFVSVFGHAGSQGARFCAFNVRKQLDKEPPPHLLVEALGRSGRFFQISYNFRTTPSSASSTSSGPSKNPPARIVFRQSIFHHQFDIVRGSSVWISLRGDKDVLTKIEDWLMPKVKRSKMDTITDRFRLALQVHVFNCKLAIEGWLLLVARLEVLLEDYRQPLIESLQSHWHESNNNTIEPLEKFKIFHELQTVEENIGNVLVFLRSNIDTVESLRYFYTTLTVLHEDEMAFPNKEWIKDVRKFEAKMDEVKDEMNRLLRRGERLVKVVADVQELALKDMDFEDTKRMENLTIITTNLGYQAQRETVAVRVITVVTVLYLPASVVSSFFSTDVIKYLSGENPSLFGRMWSAEALITWVLITGFFTLTTAFTGRRFYKAEVKKQQEQLDQFIEENKIKNARPQQTKHTVGALVTGSDNAV